MPRDWGPFLLTVVLALLVALVVLAGVTLQRITSAPAAAPCAALVRDTLGVCNDSNACTVDLVDPALGYCAHAPATSATACASDCYASGAALHCDGAGACIGDDYTQCAGYCPPYSTNSDGNALVNLQTTDGFCSLASFPIKPALLYPSYYNLDYIFDGVTFPLFLLLADAPTCFAQSCTVSVLQMTTLGIVADPPGGGFLNLFATASNCTDMLDATAGPTDCIVADAIALDTEFVSNYMYAAVFNLGTPASYNFTPGNNITGRLCTFRYACARFNESAFYDPYNIGPYPLQSESLLTPGMNLTNWWSMKRITADDTASPRHELLARRAMQELDTRIQAARKKRQLP